eukprot:11476025-Alexandrium_andersonii.AAC.1
MVPKGAGADTPHWLPAGNVLHRGPGCSAGARMINYSTESEDHVARAEAVNTDVLRLQKSRSHRHQARPQIPC